QEFAEAAGIKSIRCQLYDNDKLGAQSKQRSRFIVKITAFYKTGRFDVWFLRLLSEPRYFWRKTKKGGMSDVAAEMVSIYDQGKEAIEQVGIGLVIKPCIGLLFENHEPIQDCVGLLVQGTDDVPLVVLLLKGTRIEIAIDQPSKGSKTLKSDCG